MGQQRVRQLQKKAATPTAAPPTQKPFSWQRPFPVPAQDTATASPRPMPDLQARLEILRRANPDWSKVKASSNPAKAVQAKLTVGAPNDVYEQEADRVADQVMSMPDNATKQPVQREATPEEDEVRTKPLAAAITPLVQREEMPEEEDVQTKALAQPLDQRIGTLQREEMPEDDEALQTKPLMGTVQREEMPEEEEVQTKPLDGTLQREEMPEEDEVQTKALSSIQREEMPEEEEVQTKTALQRSTDGSLQASGSIESRLSSSQGGGSPLPDDVRSFMEPRFGADFSQVRVHTGSDAVQMNRDLNAQAFTHKQNVYFGAGRSPANDGLTAHELTHVVQQVDKAQILQRGPNSEDKNTSNQTNAINRPWQQNKKAVNELPGTGQYPPKMPEMTTDEKHPPKPAAQTNEPGILLYTNRPQYVVRAGKPGSYLFGEFIFDSPESARSFAQELARKGKVYVGKQYAIRSDFNDLEYLHVYELPPNSPYKLVGVGPQIEPTTGKQLPGGGMQMIISQSTRIAPVGNPIKIVGEKSLSKASLGTFGKQSIGGRAASALKSQAFKGTLRAVGGSLISLGIGLILSWLQEKIDQQRLEQDLKSMEQTVQERLNGFVEKVAEIQSQNLTEQVYGSITVEILYQTILYPRQIGPAYLGANLTSVDTSPSKVEDKKEFVDKFLNGMIRRTQITYSVPLELLGKDEIKQYLLTQIAKEEEGVSSTSLSEKDLQHSQRRRDLLQERLRKLGD